MSVACWTRFFHGPRKRVISHCSGTHCFDSRNRAHGEATQVLRVIQQGFEQQQQDLQMQQLRQQYEERQQQTQQPQGAPKPLGSRGSHSISSMRGFDNIETPSGGEDQWHKWSWKIKTAVSGTNGDLAELLNAAETSKVRNVEEIFKDDVCVDATREKCIKASKEMHSVLARGRRTLKRRRSRGA